MMVILYSVMSKNQKNPLTMSILILVLSLMYSMMIYKSSMSSWIPFVTVITFSSGMMILFIYSSSMMDNKMKNMKNISVMVMFVTLILMESSKSFTKITASSMKNFSSQAMMLIMAILLISVMLGIVKNSQNPSQTLSTHY